MAADPEQVLKAAQERTERARAALKNAERELHLAQTAEMQADRQALLASLPKGSGR